MQDHDSNEEQRELACTRTRLANRRTFLAWCRTALSFMAFGFLLEKVDLFLLSRHTSVSDPLLAELGLLGKLAFVGGPVLLMVAGWRYYRLERELGFGRDGLHAVPEAVLVAVIILSALIYIFR